MRHAGCGQRLRTGLPRPAARSADAEAAPPPTLPGPPGAGVKLFITGMRWAVPLPSGAVRSRLDLARAINEALVGEVASVGRGEDLSVVFVTSDGEALEMPAPRYAGGAGRRGGAGAGDKAAQQWRKAAQRATRVYVRWGGPGAAPRGLLAGGAAWPQLPGGPAPPALPAPHEELD
jgi:hypothetical protein